jgi:alanine-glyoxylate transaminase/serine-glyoxylate transaminase/serine-pyruvate transaminase
MHGGPSPSNQPPAAPGWYFLQVPGPTNVPERVTRALMQPTIDHRSPMFAALTRRVLEKIGRVFMTNAPVIIYPSSGTGAWEAALVNTLSAGDKVLMFETGHFATLWANLARRLGLDVLLLPDDWRHPVNIARLAEALAQDKSHAIKAVAIVHNETSTGVVSSVPAVRQVLDDAKHPALLMVDTVSSLGSIEYRHDDWGADVAVSASQKGLMLPPGLGFNAISAKALEAHKQAKLPRSYWDWTEMLNSNRTGFFPYSPATNMLQGLDESLSMLFEEGLDNVFARHVRHAEAARRAVDAWGLELVPAQRDTASPTLTAIMAPAGCDIDAFRGEILRRFNMSLGAGLGKLAGKAFRIGHLGGLNDLMLAAALSGVEMGLSVSAIPHRKGGVSAALDYLAATSKG